MRNFTWALLTCFHRCPHFKKELLESICAPVFRPPARSPKESTVLPSVISPEVLQGCREGSRRQDRQAVHTGQRRLDRGPGDLGVALASVAVWEAE